MSHNCLDFESFQSAKMLRILVRIQSKENCLLLSYTQSNDRGS